ncbi:MAG: metalloprotease PmbA [Legionellales bacterium]|nr:metalloprotease PmbA [Legionellales bacterium]
MISNILQDPSIEKLLSLTKYTLDQISAKGVTSAEISTGIYSGLCINSRLKNLENVEFNKEKGITITVYFGKQKGTASTTDITDNSINDTINAACSIAKTVSKDIYSGLAPKEQMAFDYPDLDLFHYWETSVEDIINQAIESEEYALGLDERITNSEGVSISTSQSYNIYANTNGFFGHYPSSKHRMSCILVAGKELSMQRDHYYTVSRNPKLMKDFKQVAEMAVKNTVGRLNPHKLKTMKVPVVFHADIASSLIGCLISALSGGNQYRKSSFLHDSLGLKALPSWITLQEKPHIKQGLGSQPFDCEGVATKNNYFIKDGIIENYILDSYTARRLSLDTTGNASGISNLHVSCKDVSLEGILKKMDRGLLITELLGHGINIVTGDYSQGAVGFWVENGEIQHAVEEITIAGNLRDMFNNILLISNDVDYRKNILTGSILIEEMTISGY